MEKGWYCLPHSVSWVCDICHALDMIVKEMWSIKTEDNRELMQSRALIKDCCAMRIDLLSNATVVDKAVKFVDRHRSLMPQNNQVMIEQSNNTISPEDGAANLS